MLPLPTAPAADLLRGDPAAIALWTDDGPISYADLGRRADAIRLELGETRRLVMLEAGNTSASIAAYAGALAGGHPVLLAPGGDDTASASTRATLRERFDPDAILADGVVRPVREGTIHELHDDLALLMSTSGSTGSPKLVRISAASLLANAEAIVEYLRITPGDRAITSLPMHYCYGLSVINSHLLAGAGLVLTDRSVSDEAFWLRAAETGVTGIAGVPYTFDLLDAVGGVDRLPDGIRYLTQAGGRLPADRVRALAAAGRERGFEFITMYGQTEATARMSYLPPEDAISGAGSIGRAIPGGSFRIDAVDGSDAGELVYSGPNVMLGYAESPADLALGRTVDELRTGDLARWRDDGYVEIVGRMNRFVKIFGLRIDLDRVQALLGQDGIAARTAADGEELLVFVHDGRDAAAANRVVSARLGLPASAVTVHIVDAFPVTSSGKPDNAALLAHHRAVTALQTGAEPADAGGATAEQVRTVLGVCTGRPDAAESDSFSTLGGDSLSYVEASVRLEELIGPLPRDWPSLTAVELADLVAPSSPAASARSADADDAAPRRRRAGAGRLRNLPALETPVLLRAIAIVLIVGTHADLFLGEDFSLKGGAHLLLIVAGYNLARFALSPAPGSRSRRLLAAAAQVVIPAVLWIGAVALISGKYALPTVLLVNGAMPSDGLWSEQWQFWFLEAMVWTMLPLVALFASARIDRIERAAPWAFALGALAVTVAVRLTLLGASPAEHVERYAVPTVLWCIALGWVIARADSIRRRVVASVLAVVLVPGFFGDPLREGIIAAGVLLLIWVAAVRVPGWLRPPITLIAQASLFIYLTHWVVYPPFERTAPLVGTLLSLIVGVAAWAIHRRISRLLSGSAALSGAAARRRMPDTARPRLRSGD